MLSKLCIQNGLEPFLHNIQSVYFLDRIERGGRGWNLTLQTLDGIMCHDGEVHDNRLLPQRGKTFAEFDRQLQEKLRNPKFDLLPMTLEGCLVRCADTVAYIGRDIEDAIELQLIERRDIPQEVREILGDTNGTIVYTLVADLIAGSHGKDAIAFSPAISENLLRLKKFNYERIYLNQKIKGQTPLIEACYSALFEHCCEAIGNPGKGSSAVHEFLAGLGEEYRQTNGPAAIARDFIAGMTDDFFIRQAGKLGCRMPARS